MTLTAIPSDGDKIREDYLTAIKNAITNHPRSLQKALGPSEVGTDCARRLAYKLLDHPENDRGAPWKPTIGTAVHAWLEDVFDRDNLNGASGVVGEERWLVESRVTVGESDALGPITGSSDLFDRLTGTVIDHKVVGKTQLTKYRRNGPSQQYRIQAHLYGRGFARLGHTVNTVAIAFLPRDGELDDMHLWTEPYDEQIAIDGLTRLEGIATAAVVLGHDALPMIPTTDQWCGFCPYFRSGSDDLAVGCPGDNASSASNTNTNQLAGLIPA